MYILLQHSLATLIHLSSDNLIACTHNFFKDYIILISFNSCEIFNDSCNYDISNPHSMIRIRITLLNNTKWLHYFLTKYSTFWQTMIGIIAYLGLWLMVNKWHVLIRILSIKVTTFLKLNLRNTNVHLVCSYSEACMDKMWNSGI